MDNGILLIAHAPLASALRQCVAHVFPDQLAGVLALDVQASVSADASLAQARDLLARFGGRPVLLLTDMLGATPCNVACRLAQEVGADNGARLVAGVNLSMLLRAVTYRGEVLPLLVDKALAGGAQGIVEVPVSRIDSKGQT